MSVAAPTQSHASRRALALSIYVAGIIGLAAIIFASLVALVAGLDELGSAKAIFTRLDQRKGPVKLGVNAEGPTVAGSPFLEGQTVTIAGAALQQRIDDAVKKAGGNLQSTQIELQGPSAAQGFVTITANFEITQLSLQSFLYDIEAGMPYLFIDSLAIQAPQAVGDSDAARMRVQIGVSGKWQAPK